MFNWYKISQYEEYDEIDDNVSIDDLMELHHLEYIVSRIEQERSRTLWLGDRDDRLWGRYVQDLNRLCDRILRQMRVGFAKWHGRHSSKEGWLEEFLPGLAYGKGKMQAGYVWNFDITKELKSAIISQLANLQDYRPYIEEGYFLQNVQRIADDPRMKSEVDRFISDQSIDLEDQDTYDSLGDMIQIRYSYEFMEWMEANESLNPLGEDLSNYADDRDIEDIDENWFERFVGRDINIYENGDTDGEEGPFFDTFVDLAWKYGYPRWKENFPGIEENEAAVEKGLHRIDEALGSDDWHDKTVAITLGLNVSHYFGKMSEHLGISKDQLDELSNLDVDDWEEEFQSLGIRAAKNRNNLHVLRAEFLKATQSDEQNLETQQTTEWLSRHRIEQDGEFYVFYHGTPKDSGVAGELRSGSLLAETPEDAAFFAARDRDGVNAPLDPQRDITVYRVLVRPEDIYTGVFASLRRPVSVNSIVAQNMRNRLVLAKRTTSATSATSAKYKMSNEQLNLFNMEEPKRLRGYHGTNKDFNEFDYRPGVRRILFNEWETTPMGFFFTEDLDTAKEYGKKVKEAYLDLQKPFIEPNMRFVLDDRKINDLKYVLEPMVGEDDNGRFIEIGVQKYYIENRKLENEDDWVYYAVGSGGLAWDVLDSPKCAARIKMLGYDGTYVDEPNDQNGISIFVFDRDQIEIIDQNVKDLEEDYEPDNYDPEHDDASVTAFNWYRNIKMAQKVKKKKNDEMDSFMDQQDKENVELEEMLDRESEQYFNIGHAESENVAGFYDNVVWLYLGGQLLTGPESEGTHSMQYGDNAEQGWKGRYDAEQNLVSIAPPKHLIGKDLYRRVPVPTRLLNRLNELFEGAEFVPVGGATLSGSNSWYKVSAYSNSKEEKQNA